MLELIGQKVPGPPPLGGTAPTKGYPPLKFQKSLALKKYSTFKISNLP